ncbi:MAG: hypothetical protein K0Q59_3975 [Paenibacillus sp.]|nr:hypothetical protein [Paenibacillus sp.]
MRAIVLDDEPLIVKHMERLLAGAGVEVVGGFTNPYEVLETMKALQPDVMFLDIEMPELSGLDIAERVYADKLDMEIVFITAYNQYAIDAFRVNALDYLLKPIMEEDLQRSLDRVGRRRQHREGIVGTGGQRKAVAALFGRFTLYWDDDPEDGGALGGEQPAQASRPVRWTTSKCAELFAYLLLQPEEKEVGKWEMFEALWPNQNTEKAGINLRSSVSRVNKTLRDCRSGITLVSIRNGYRLVLGGEMISVDAAELERCVLDAIEPTVDNLAYIEQLIHRCSQPFLPEFDGDWCEIYRKRYRQYFLHLGKKLLQYYMKAETEPFKTLRLVDLLVDHSPYDESLREAALTLHHRVGGPQGAAAYYEAYASILKIELGIVPGSALSERLRSLTE